MNLVHAVVGKNTKNAVVNSKSATKKERSVERSFLCLESLTSLKD